ncbi:hypothetical protein D9Q98_009174 [Chlorella vulgaris]|uniref:Uncharacterized protein n=1 Tax=Chlorella vulgaris TaxID=3077 RepID=A0A9D4TNZ0_CHLVU|nr:hypothetical protein D9Q98_009174 [Chlorella vulgaris]
MATEETMQHDDEASVPETPTMDEPEAEVDTESVAEERVPIVLSTAKPDPRFPATNQSKACYVWYNEMHKCYAKEGQDADACLRIKKDVRSICPVEWLETWDEAKAEGRWWGKY